jgi:prepilin-type N-terminal cleavage/methylation domain-containing protein
MNGYLTRVLGDRWRRLRGGASPCDTGMTLVEMLIAMALISVAVLGLLGELAADIKQQTTERTQTNAVHLASSSLESARNLPWSSLTSPAILGTHTTTPTVSGVTYTNATTVQLCSPTDAPGVCTTPATGSATTARATVAVSWTSNGASHTVKMARNLADNSSTTTSTTTNPLGTCGGSGVTLVSGSLALSPSTTIVNSSGHPPGNITATLTATGLSNTSCVPLTWSDDAGAHQLTMTGGGGTYSVTIPASSITKTVATSGGTVAFTATVPGSQAVPSTNLTIQGAPTLSACTVSVASLGLNTITLNPLTRKSLLPATLTCTATNLSNTDSVKATYQSGSSTATATLASSNGTTWTATLPSGTQLATGLVGSETFTFKLTRASDGATDSKPVTVTLL